MTRIIISRFDGGMPNDIRTSSTNQCETSENFDIATNPHELRPYSDPIAETSSGTISDYTITDVVTMVPSGSSTETLYAMGRNSSGSQDVAIFKKSSTSDITAPWGTPSATNANDVQPGSLIEYKGFLWFVAGAGQLHKYTDPSTIAVIGTMGAPLTSGNYAPKPIRHKADDTVYLASGSKVYKFDNVTYTTPTELHNMGDNNEVRSLCEYGNYLAIATCQLYSAKRSAVYLSNKDITTPQEKPVTIIPWGTESLKIIENIGGTIVGISTTENQGGYTSVVKNKLFIKVMSGGQAVTLKEIELDNSNLLRVYKDKINERIYFGYDGDTTMWVCGKNDLGQYYVTRDRFIAPTGVANTTFNGISFIGDISFTAYSSGLLARQGTGSSYTLTASYTTTINPGMRDGDVVLKKKLVRVRVSYTVNDANGTAGLLIRKDGETSYTSAISQSQSATGQYTTDAFAYADGTPFGDDFYDIQLKPTSTGNVSITAIEYEYTTING